MKRLEKLPSAFKRYDRMRGALDFAVFDDAKGTEEEILSAIPQTLPQARTFDAERLRSLGCKRIKERRFFGDWYDFESGMLLKIGSFKTADGSELQDPKLKMCDGVKILSGASPRPDARAGGQFAYAFFNPPYGIKGRPSDAQATFEEIRDFILPPIHQAEICDWSNPQLAEASDYFAAGMEWWGVFLFSIYIPAIQQLTIIAGSATD